CGCRAVQEEVVPLDGGADQARADDLLDGCGGHAVTLGSDHRHSYGSVTHTLAGACVAEPVQAEGELDLQRPLRVLPAVAAQPADPLQPLGDGVDVDVQGPCRA